MGPGAWFAQGRSTILKALLVCTGQELNIQITAGFCARQEHNLNISAGFAHGRGTILKSLLGLRRAKAQSYKDPCAILEEPKQIPRRILGDSWRNPRRILAAA